MAKRTMNTTNGKVIIDIAFDLKTGERMIKTLNKEFEGLDNGVAKVKDTIKSMNNSLSDKSSQHGRYLREIRSAMNTLNSEMEKQVSWQKRATTEATKNRNLQIAAIKDVGKEQTKAITAAIAGIKKQSGETKQLTEEQKKFLQKQKEMQSAIKTLSGAGSGMASSFQKGIIVANQFMELMRKAAIMVEYLSKPIGEAGQFEQYRVVLKNLIGDVDIADSRFREMVEFAKKTPFTIEGVVDAGNKLQALGRYSKETLRDIGDLAAASGKDVTQAMEAYANLVTGRVGMAVKQFRAMLITTTDWTRETGKAVFRNAKGVKANTEELLEAFARIIRKKNFAGLMDEQSRTLLGKVSNLKDSLQTAMAKIGDTFLDQSKGIVTAITNIFNSVAKNGAAVGTALKFSGSLVVITGLAFALGKMAFAIREVYEAVMFVKAGGGIVTALGVLSAGKIMAIVAAVAALTAAVIYLYNMNDRSTAAKIESLGASIAESDAIVNEAKSRRDSIASVLELIDKKNKLTKGSKEYKDTVEELAGILPKLDRSFGTMTKNVNLTEDVTKRLNKEMEDAESWIRRLQQQIDDFSMEKMRLEFEKFRVDTLGAFEDTLEDVQEKWLNLQRPNDAPKEYANRIANILGAGGMDAGGMGGLKNSLSSIYLAKNPEEVKKATEVANIYIDNLSRAMEKAALKKAGGDAQKALEYFGYKEASAFTQLKGLTATSANERLKVLSSTPSSAIVKEFTTKISSSIQGKEGQEQIDQLQAYLSSLRNFGLSSKGDVTYGFTAGGVTKKLDYGSNLTLQKVVSDMIGQVQDRMNGEEENQKIIDEENEKAQRDLINVYRKKYEFEMKELKKAKKEAENKDQLPTEREAEIKAASNLRAGNIKSIMGSFSKAKGISKESDDYKSLQSTMEGSLEDIISGVAAGSIQSYETRLKQARVMELSPGGTVNEYNKIAADFVSQYGDLTNPEKAARASEDLVNAFRKILDAIQEAKDTVDEVAASKSIARMYDYNSKGMGAVTPQGVVSEFSKNAYGSKGYDTAVSNLFNKGLVPFDARSSIKTLGTKGAMELFDQFTNITETSTTAKQSFADSIPDVKTRFNVQQDLERNKYLAIAAAGKALLKQIESALIDGMTSDERGMVEGKDRAKAIAERTAKTNAIQQAINNAENKANKTEGETAFGNFDIDQKAWKDKLDLAQNGFDQLNNMYDLWSNNAKQRIQEEVETWKQAQMDKLDIEKSAVMEYARTDKQKARVDKEYDKRKIEIEKQAKERQKEQMKTFFEYEKAMKIVQVTMAGAMLAMNLAASFSALNIFGLPIAIGIASAFTAGQIALIAGQEMPDTGYKVGGFTGQGDDNKVAGKVHKNEFVVNAKATKKNRSLLESLNDGTFSYNDFSKTAPINVNRDYYLAQEIKRSDTGIVNELRNLGGLLKEFSQNPIAIGDDECRRIAAIGIKKLRYGLV